MSAASSTASGVVEPRMLPPCSRRMQTVDDAFLRVLYNYQAAMRRASSAALLCNLAALGNLCLPNAYSRAAGSRPFKNGLITHSSLAAARDRDHEVLSYESLAC